MALSLKSNSTCGGGGYTYLHDFLKSDFSLSSKYSLSAKQRRAIVTVLTIAFFGFATYPTNANAETITNTAGSTSDYYVSLTSNDTISLPVNPDNSIHTVTDTLTATSNTGSGYRIFVSMADNTANSNRLYLNGDTTSSSYLTPTTTTTLDTNSWGVSTDTTENKSYSAMPLLGNELLVKDFADATPSTTIPVTYGAKADMTSPAGIYKGEIVYSILANSPADTLISPTTTGLDGGDTLTISTPLMNSLDLTSNTPTATVTIGTLVDGTMTNSSTCTNPTISKNTNTGIYEVACTLPAKEAGSYDVVVAYTGLQGDNERSYTASSQLTYRAPDSTITGLTYMQDITLEACENTAENVSAVLEDKRDGQKYTVFKAKDGNCWMGENLRFGAMPDSSDTPAQVPTGRAWNADTDPALTNTTSEGATKLADLTYDSTNPATAGRVKTGQSDNKTANGTNNAFSSAGDNYTKPYIYTYQANNTGTQVGWTSGNDKDYQFGVLYNYCAATGGTVCNKTAMSANAAGSICPSGWMLPGMSTNAAGSNPTTNGYIKTYNNLFNAYGASNATAGANIAMSSPLGYVRAGYALDNTLSSRVSNGYGYYWTSTKNTATTTAYRLNLYSSKLSRTTSNRYYGASVRCVSQAASDAITAFSPQDPWTTGGGNMTLTTNIPSTDTFSVSSISIGDSPCTNPTVSNSGSFHEITCTYPALSAGSYIATAAITHNGKTKDITSSPITYVEPAISSVSPSTLELAGGETLTIVLNLTSSTAISNASVTIGDTACTNPTITTSDSYRAITCTTPAKATGTYTVAVSITRNGATANLSLVNAVLYPYCDIGSGNCMQDIATVCPTLSEHQTRTLMDARDAQEYTVFKAKDGNCWMGENLRYGINPDGSGHPFVAADAAPSDNVNSTKMLHLTYDSTNPNTAGRIKNYSGNVEGTMKTANGAIAFSSAYENYTEPYINIADANNAAGYDGGTKYGVLYNYCAATGGRVCNSNAMSADAAGSICPSGWKMPGMTANLTDTTDKTYNKLFNAYSVTSSADGFAKMTAAPLSFVQSGYASYGLLHIRSATGGGYHWSSTKYTNNTTNAYGLGFNSSYVGYASYGARYNGLSLRCVSS